MERREFCLGVLCFLLFAQFVSWLYAGPDSPLCLIEPENYEQSADDNYQNYCPTFVAGSLLLSERGFQWIKREDNDKAVVAAFTIVLGISTIGLWLATIGLYQAGERQLAHFKAESDAADFHRTAQFEQIAEQITALRQSAEYAEATAHETQRLVWTAEDTAMRQLRAYVVAGAKSVDIRGTENEVWVSVQITIKNTGQTPAHDLSIVSKTELIEHPIKMPFDFTLISGPDPSVAVLGAGELTETESRPEKPFDGNEMMVAQESESGARIYTRGRSHIVMFSEGPATPTFAIALFSPMAKSSPTPASTIMMPANAAQAARAHMARSISA